MSSHASTRSAHESAPSEAPHAAVLGAVRTSVMDAAALGVAAVRIPALLLCSNGRLIAFAEARHDGAGDSGTIEVVASVRFPSGRWSTPQVVAGEAGRTMGNPVPMEAGDGAVVLLTTSNAATVTEAQILAGRVTAEEGRRVHVSRLRCTDDGVEVLEPARDVTAQTKDPRWGWYATGPGHGVRLSSGRLVVAANHSAPALGGGWQYGAHGLLSEDDGHSWRLAWTADAATGLSGPNESSLTVGPAGADGTECVRVTSRNEAADPEPSRMIGQVPLPEPASPGATRSAEFAVLEGFRGPRLQCGLAEAPADVGADAFLTAPPRPHERRDLALSAIVDHQCRPLGRILEGPAGYTDLACTEQEILVLVETGEQRTHERIDLLSIDLAEARAASRSPKEQKA